MEWLSLSEIADQAGVTKAVVRRYAAVFKDFLPCKKIDGEARYPSQTVAIFQRIARADQEAELDSVAELGHGSAPAIPDPSEPGEALEGSRDLTDTLGQLMESVSRCLVVIADQKSFIEAQQRDIDRLKSGFALLARNQKKLASRPASAAALPATGEIEQVVRNSLAGHEEMAKELLSRDQEFENRAAILEKGQSAAQEQAERLDQGQQDIRTKIEVLEAELVRLRK
ncbi:MAG: hypothetical protein ACOCVM_05415, partial [Desulfovibrionaceae bacterium]